MDNLVCKFKNGDTKALEYLIDKYSTALLCFVKSYIHDEARAKDVVQESFIALWSKKEGFSEDSNLKSLLYTICKNRAINMIRDEKKFRNNVDVAIISEANIKSLSYIQTDMMEESDMVNRINNLIEIGRAHV